MIASGPTSTFIPDGSVVTWDLPLRDPNDSDAKLEISSTTKPEIKVLIQKKTLLISNQFCFSRILAEKVIGEVLLARDRFFRLTRAASLAIKFPRPFQIAHSAHEGLRGVLSEIKNLPGRVGQISADRQLCDAVHY
jgi:hypothetical protein